MRECKFIDTFNGCKFILNEISKNDKCYIAKCNTGKIFDISYFNRDKKERFIDALSMAIENSGKSVYHLMTKVCNRYKINAINYKSIKEADTQNKLSIDKNICLCVIRQDKNNFFIIKGYNEHIIYRRNNLYRISEKTLDKVIVYLYKI